MRPHFFIVIAYVALTVGLIASAAGCGAGAAQTHDRPTTVERGAPPPPSPRVVEALALADRVTPPDVTDVSVVLAPRRLVEAGRAALSDAPRRRLLDGGWISDALNWQLYAQPDTWVGGAVDLDAPIVVASWRSADGWGGVTAFARRPGGPFELRDVAGWWTGEDPGVDAVDDPDLGRPVLLVESGAWIDLGHQVAVAFCEHEVTLPCHADVLRRTFGPRPASARAASWGWAAETIDPDATGVNLSVDPDGFSDHAIVQGTTASIDASWDHGDAWVTARRLLFDEGLDDAIFAPVAAGQGVQAVPAEDRPVVFVARLAPDSVARSLERLAELFGPPAVDGLAAAGLTLADLADASTGELAVVGLTRPQLPGASGAGFVLALRMREASDAAAVLERVTETARAAGTLTPTFDNGEWRWVALGPAGSAFTFGQVGDLLVAGTHTLVVDRFMSHHTGAIVRSTGDRVVDASFEPQALLALTLGRTTALGAALGAAVPRVTVGAAFDTDRSLILETRATVEVSAFEPLVAEALDGDESAFVAQAFEGFFDRRIERLERVLDADLRAPWPPEPGTIRSWVIDIPETRRINARRDRNADQQGMLDACIRYGFSMHLAADGDAAWSLVQRSDDGQMVIEGIEFGRLVELRDGSWVVAGSSIVDGTPIEQPIYIDAAGRVVLDAPVAIAMTEVSTGPSPWADPLVTRLHGGWVVDLDRTARSALRVVDDPGAEAYVRADFEQAGLRWTVGADGTLTLVQADSEVSEVEWRPAYVAPDSFAWTTGRDRRHYAWMEWIDGSIVIELDTGVRVWLQRAEE